MWFLDDELAGKLRMKRDGRLGPRWDRFTRDEIDFVGLGQSGRNRRFKNQRPCNEDAFPMCRGTQTDHRPKLLIRKLTHPGKMLENRLEHLH
ncbi:hypothetical protein PDE_04728 [Penicillium oxalicum 114-2]|uniref:Uncharacterized protein n=1 Tax=Penicillium oxalicum (strain 114-2 / CGMCC 5302) TaxID=933388 RepID=S8AUG1_PENO1|nr:hypothetical protein PDE_04728 [Penicillium oxalicum 114-2]